MFFNGNDPKFSGNNIQFNDIVNIIKPEEMLKNPELKLFHNRKLEWHIRIVDKPQNISIPDADIYINRVTEEKTCTFFDNMDFTADFSFLLIIVIPILFIITTIVLVIMCLKYKSKVNEYMHLQNRDREQESSGIL